MFDSTQTFSELYFVEHGLDLEDLLPRVLVQVEVVEASSALLQPGVHGQHQRSPVAKWDLDFFRVLKEKC